MTDSFFDHRSHEPVRLGGGEGIYKACDRHATKAYSGYVEERGERDGRDAWRWRWRQLQGIATEGDA